MIFSIQLQQKDDMLHLVKNTLKLKRIVVPKMDNLIVVEVIVMKQQQQQNKTASGTNIQHVKQQNAQAGQGIQAQNQQQFGTEFGSSNTDVQRVKQQNQQSAQRKQQASGQMNQQQQPK